MKKRYLLHFGFIVFMFLFVLVLVVDIKTQTNNFTVRNIERQIKSYNPETKKKAIKFLIKNDEPSDVLLEEEPYELIKNVLENGSVKILDKLNKTLDLKDKKKEISDYLEENENIPSEINILRWACMSGELEIVKWVIDNFEITTEIIRQDNSFCFIHCIGNGYIELAEFLRDKFSLNRGDAAACDNSGIIWACLNGKLDMVKWLCENFELTKQDILDSQSEAIINCCLSGFFNILKYLNDTFKLNKNDVIIGFGYITRHSLSDLDWFINVFNIERTDVIKEMKKILGFISVNNLEYLISKFNITQKELMKEDYLTGIIIEDRDDILEFLNDTFGISQKTIYNNDNFIYKYASSHNSTKVCSWLVKKFKIL